MKKEGLFLEIFKDNQPIPLNDHLCFSLYATSRAIQKLYHTGLSECKLTYPQYLVLVALSEHDELTVKKLGELLSLDSGTLTPLLKRLENEKLVIRNRSKDDERVVNVELTEAGKKKRQEANNLPEILVQKSGLSEDEWFQLENLSNKLYKNITD